MVQVTSFDCQKYDTHSDPISIEMSDLWNYNDGEDSDLSDSQGVKSTVESLLVRLGDPGARRSMRPVFLQSR